MTTIRRLLVLAPLLVTLGCLDDLPQPNHVTGLRVLGIQAEPPEVAPGDSVALRALIVDADDRAVTRTWRACLLPERIAGFGAGQTTSSSGGKGYSATDPGTCFDAELGSNEDLIDLGTGEEATLSIPPDLFADLDEVAAIYGLGPESGIPPQAIALFLSIAGLNITVALEVKTTDGASTLTAFKRVNVSTASVKNQNPTNVVFHITRDLSGELPPDTGTPPGEGRCFLGEEVAPIQVKPGRYLITALNIPDPPLRYPVLVGGSDETSQAEACVPAIPGCEIRDEVWFFSFFSKLDGLDGNIVKSTKAPSMIFDIPSEGLEDTVPIWIVTRDGRGGATWCHSELVVVD